MGILPGRSKLRQIRLRCVARYRHERHRTEPDKEVRPENLIVAVVSGWLTMYLCVRVEPALSVLLECFRFLWLRDDAHLP